MTFDDDEIHLQFSQGTRVVKCLHMGLDWPPPKRISVFGFGMRLLRCSSMTDAQRASKPNMVRSAEYILE